MFTHFYSDPHFGHTNILKYTGRPFDNILDHDAELIRKYNLRVSSTDRVLWLGDAFFCSQERARHIMDELNGLKYLIRGNHDNKASQYYLRLGFDVVADKFSLQIRGVECICYHYPPRGQEASKSTHVNKCLTPYSHQRVIHGHCHQHHKVSGLGIHVGVDAWDYAPATYKEVEALV